MKTDRWQLLSPYLDRALDMSADERSAWLASLRAEDAGLAQQLETLLLEHDALAEEGFLDCKTVVLPGNPGLAGQRLGAYTLLSPIGQGGMGSVWLAERNDGRFERQVAVKFLNMGLIGKGGEERFKQEGAILGALTHPHIAGLLDSGVTSAGQPYLVLEYVDGKQIDKYCDHRALDVRARVRLFLDVLSAVAHAHSNLVVHRDIKPSNVLVANDGEVKLLDFGIAKLIAADDAHEGHTRLTHDGAIPMTPEYAAPEQLQGGPVTTVTDVYVLGVLLYVLLTGQHPVAKGNASPSPAELVKAVVEKTPAPPSQVVAQTDANLAITLVNAARRGTTPEKLSRTLIGDLDVIILKALKKDPAERYGAATDLAEDLRRFLRNQPIHARPDTFSYRASKFVRRNRTAVALAIFATLGTVGGLIGTYTQNRSARVQCNLAMQQLRRKQALAELNQFLLSDAAPAGKPFTVNELLQRAEVALSHQHANDDTDRVELLVSIGDQYSTQDDDIKARRVLEEAYKLSRALPKGPTRAEASCSLAGALARDGDLPRAENLFQEGLRELTTESDYDQERIFCLRRGSEVAQENGNAKEGIRRMEEAQRVLKDSPFHSDILDLSVSMDLAEAYRMAGENRQAVEKFEQASKLLTSLGRENTQNAVTMYNDWALALARLGRPLEAERLFERAIAVSSTGKSDQSVSPMVLKNYASTLRELGRLNDAAIYAEKAYSKARQVDNRVVIYQAQYLRALIYLEQGNLRRSQAMLADAEPRLHASLPPDNYWFGALASVQAMLASRQRNFPQALALADHAVAITETAIRNGGEGSDFLPILLLRRSSVRFDAGDFSGAAADAEHAGNLFAAAIGPGDYSSNLGKASLAFARALQAQGKQGEAQDAYRAAAEQLQNTLGSDHRDTRNARQQASLAAPRRTNSPRA